MENLQKETVDNIDMKDSDGDGIYDIYEINGIKLSNNKIVYTFDMIKAFVDLNEEELKEILKPEKMTQLMREKVMKAVS